MNIYTWLVILIILAAVISKKANNPKRTFIALSCIMLFCLLGFRDAYSIGNDSSSSYLLNFQTLGQTEWDEVTGKGEFNQNIGFNFLTKAIYSLFDGDYQCYIVLLSAFTIFAFGHFVRRYSPDPLQSVLYYLGLLLFMNMFNILKQGLAMSFVLLSFDAIVERKPVKFLLLMALATFIHFPAIVFLPAYWIAILRTNRTYLLFLFALLALTYFFRDRMLDQMLDLYEEAEYNINFEGVVFLRTKALLMLLIVVAAVLLRPPTTDDFVYSTLLKFMGVAIVFQTFCGYSNIFERLADYYFQFAVVFMPLMFENVRLKRQLFDSKTLFVFRTLGPYAFCAFGIWRFIDRAVNNPHIYPYYFFFQSRH